MGLPGRTRSCPVARPVPKAGPRDEAGFFSLPSATSPDDDTTRLVFADWLDETINRPAGELIRVAIERRPVSAEGPGAALADQRASIILDEYEVTWTVSLRRWS